MPGEQGEGGNSSEPLHEKPKAFSEKHPRAHKMLQHVKTRPAIALASAAVAGLVGVVGLTDRHEPTNDADSSQGGAVMKQEKEGSSPRPEADLLRESQNQQMKSFMMEMGPQFLDLIKKATNDPDPRYKRTQADGTPTFLAALARHAEVISKEGEEILDKQGSYRVLADSRLKNDDPEEYYRLRIQKDVYPKQTGGKVDSNEGFEIELDDKGNYMLFKWDVGPNGPEVGEIKRTDGSEVGSTLTQQDINEFKQGVRNMFSDSVNNKPLVLNDR